MSLKRQFVALLLLLCVSSFPVSPGWAKEDLRIEPGRHVKLSYKLVSEGKVVESSKRKKPLEFEFKTGQVWPAFEENILGMKVGEKKDFELRPEEAFGVWDANYTKIIHKSSLPNQKFKPGMLFTAENPVTAQTVTGRVSKIIGDEVGIDFNHPLAGKTLLVKVKVIEVS